MTNTAVAQVPTPGHPVRREAGAHIVTWHAHHAGHHSVHVEHASSGVELDHLRRTWSTADEAARMVANAVRFLTLDLAA
jgi:hypothetical protein